MLYCIQTPGYFYETSLLLAIVFYTEIVYRSYTEVSKSRNNVISTFTLKDQKVQKKRNVLICKRALIVAYFPDMSKNRLIKLG